MKAWRNKRIIIILTLATFIVPIRIPISPNVDVTIVDKFERPVVENAVRQDWEYRTIWATRRNSEVRQTDRNGYIDFPKRYYWSLIGSEIVDWVENSISMGHAGFGTEAVLVIYGSEPGIWPCGKSDSLPDKIKLVETAQAN
jgi:hypothetical protein